MIERERLQDFVGNGDKAKGTFSDAEMQRRLDAIRKHMADNNVDAALFTSYHNINYYADFMYCQFGRRYGFFVDHDHATSISAGIDGGQPWRRTFGGRNLTYTDWQKDNYFHAIRQIIGKARRIGIEFDHVNIDLLNLLKAEFPGVEFVDIAAPAMRLRMIKSAEEIAHITEMARIADLGGAACVEATAVGVPEHEVALHSTATMVREIAKSWPDGELLDTWTWFQSGVNTDGAFADAPGYMLTGDFVFSGDLGRPDLLDEAAGGVDTRFEGAQQLFASLKAKFLTLPDHVQVFPAHGAGSGDGDSHAQCSSGPFAMTL